MGVASPTTDDIRAAAITGLVLGVLATSYRVQQRIRNGSFWLDDAFAIASMVFFVLFFGALLVHFSPQGTIPHDSAIAVYYIVSQSYYAILWTARISFMFSVVRISPNAHQKKQLVAVIVSFGVMWAFLLAQIFYVCEKSGPLWKDAPIVQCDLGQSVAIAQLITVIIADTLLIAAPLRLLLRVKVEQTLRLRLIALLILSILMTAVSLVHTVYIMLGDRPLEEALSATVEDGVALFICNLAVVFSAAYRLIRRNSDNRSSIAHSTITKLGTVTLTGSSIRGVGSSKLSTISSDKTWLGDTIFVGPDDSQTSIRVGTDAYGFERYDDRSWSSRGGKRALSPVGIHVSKETYVMYSLPPITEQDSFGLGLSDKF